MLDLRGYALTRKIQRTAKAAADFRRSAKEMMQINDDHGEKRQAGADGPPRGQLYAKRLGKQSENTKNGHFQPVFGILGPKI